MIDPTVSGHYTGDCRVLLEQLPEACVQTCITSPPYWGLRDYGVDGQLGLEATPEEWVANMVAVFAGVRRVLRDDGTLWLNIGDAYAQGGRGGIGDASGLEGSRDNQNESRRAIELRPGARRVPAGYKPKDLIGMPWMLAFALRADGWFLRADIVWHKVNALPENVHDRPTKTHEYIFLLSKSRRYFYDAEAIREPVTGGAHDRGHGVTPKALAAAPGSRQNPSWSAAVRKVNGAPVADTNHDLVLDRGDGSGRTRRSQGEPQEERQQGACGAQHGGAREHASNQKFGIPWEDQDGRRNKRSVWAVPLAPYGGGHFATFPPALIDPCVLAGTRVGAVFLGDGPRSAR